MSNVIRRAKRIMVVVLSLWLAAAASSAAEAASWPCYRHGPTRNPVTDEQLPDELSLRWVHVPAYKPAPAWPASEGYTALEFDYAFQMTSGRGMLFFGSSGDDRIYALDAETGRVRWSFQTGAPVRFAPELRHERVFAASDDGRLYCLAADTGKLLWKFDAAPFDDRVIGNGRMISRWPMRSGLMVDGDTVYCLAGMWPAEGVFIYALDAESGREIWRNDTAGLNYSDKPHLAAGFGEVAPQGALAASVDKLFIPTGRSVPSVFDKRSGAHLYWRQTVNEKTGGTGIVAAGAFFFNIGTDRSYPSVITFNETDGDYVHTTGGRDFLATDDAYYYLGGWLVGFDRRAVDFILAATHIHERHKRYTRFNACRTWHLAHGIPEPGCFLKAGEDFFVAGRGAVKHIRPPRARIRSLEEPQSFEVKYRGAKKGSVRLAKTEKGLALELRARNEEWKNPADEPSWELFFDFRPFRPAPRPDYGRGAFQLIVKPARKTAVGRLSPARWRKGVGPLHPEIVLSSTPGATETVTSVLIPWSELEKITRRKVEEFRFAARLNTADKGLPVRAPLWARDFAELAVVGLERFTLKEGAKTTPPEICSPKVLWTGKFDGRARGMIVADGRLFVSTQEGAIYCFGAKTGAAPKTIKSEFTDSPYPEDETAALYRRLARRIVDETKITKGWCLDYGAGEGRLALELAKLTELKIVCVEPDEAKARRAREAIHKSGLYGNRIVVDRVPLSKLPYPDYFANLVVAGDLLTGGLRGRSAREMLRCLRPYGGRCVLGRPAGARERVTFNDATFAEWFRAGNMKGFRRMQGEGLLYTFTRGALAGAAFWTHQNGNPGRTNSTPDKLVKPPLEMLWFGPPGPARMIDRHKYPSQQVSSHGRLYIAGKDSITCVDAYNGTELWVTKEAGGGRDFGPKKGSPIVADETTLWVARGRHCLELEGETGAVRARHELPGGDGVWGYIASVGRVLLGTEVESLKKIRENRRLFALDKKSGRLLWDHKPDGAIELSQIVAGEGKVIFVDGTAYSKRKEIQHRGGDRSQLKYKLIALDLGTGKVLWTNKDVGYGGEYCLSEGLVIKNRSYPTGGRLTAFSADTGKVVWSASAKYDFGPRLVTAIPALVSSGRIFMWGAHFDLKTGKHLMRTHPISLQKEPWDFRWHSGCGTMNASASTLFARSGALGIYDFIDDAGVANYGGAKPGCTNSFYPSGGLLLCPETSSGCTCTYSFQTSYALKPAKRKNEYWCFFSGLGKGSVIRYMAINVGAPGHRRDKDGRLWFSFPGPNFVNRIHQSVGMENLYHDAYNRHFKRYEEFLKYFALTVGFLKYWPTYPGDWAKYYHRNADVLRIENTDRPWIYSSGSNGIRQIRFYRVDAGATYTIRFHFAEILGAVPGERVFDVRAGGKTVLENVDVVKDAGGPNRALVKEVTGVKPAGTLTVEFVAKDKVVTKDNCPILSGIELIAEKK